VTMAKAQPDIVGNADIEAWLTERSVQWEFNPTLPLDRVDRARSLTNQARLEPLNQEVVDRYTADMNRGDQFPPVIALDAGGRGKLRLLGGNHRLWAHVAAGHKTLPAYVVKAEPEMAMRLTYEDNRRHGLPPSDDERIIQAIHLIDTGWTQEAAAACVGVPSPRISQERTMIKAARRAKDLGLDIDAFNALQRNARYHLGRLRSDPVFVEASALAIKARMSVDQVKELCTRLQDAKSDNDAMQVIGLEEESLRDRIQRTGGGKAKRTRTPRVDVLMGMRQIRNRAADAVLGSIPSPEARAALRKEVDETIEHLEGLRKVLR
jgi:ParB-like chromosome segregation protein Spo0J